MDRVHRIVMALVAWSMATAAFGAHREHLSVRVYNTSVTARTFSTAIREAARLLGEAGVEAEWHDCSVAARPASAVPSLCGDPLQQREVIVRVASAPQGAPNPRRLGEALVDGDSGTGSFATIFADRVAVVARDAGLPRASLLGAVMAHEIAHLLGAGHGPDGLMGAPWSQAELHRSHAHGWRFSPDEGERMRRTLKEPSDTRAPLSLPLASVASGGRAPSAYTDLR
ncbi:MAG TPA: hypothetical protein VN654_00815 [Vicinamibacterales bacterium]|jgi:hypothetical protein|nr:hypothetical protein [Vicinamibacterales bacterium]